MAALVPKAFQGVKRSERAQKKEEKYKEEQEKIEENKNLIRETFISQIDPDSVDLVMEVLKKDTAPRTPSDRPAINLSKSTLKKMSLVSTSKVSGITPPLPPL